LDEKVFTTSGGVGERRGGDFRRGLRRQLQPELLDQKLEFALRLGVSGQHQLSASVVGRWTSIICTAANFSKTRRAVSPGTRA
jgi:hypothetical protein